jgi:hypothetical protein
MSGKQTRRRFGRARQEGEAGSAADADADRIVAVRLTRATRRTEQLLRRIDALERRVKDLEGRLDQAEPRASRAGRFRRLQNGEPPASPPSSDPGEGARIVASQMLESGIPAERVAEHLRDVFDLPDPERVVADVAGDERGR